MRGGEEEAEAKNKRKAWGEGEGEKKVTTRNGNNKIWRSRELEVWVG